MKVALLTTGQTEFLGLATALGQFFPHHEFYSVQKFVQPPPHRQEPLDGFTSNRLSEKHETDPPESALELVQRAAQEALRDRGIEPADHVVVLDDLEVVNLDQPARVVDVFRSAVAKHLTTLSGGVRERTETALKEKVSFHLVVPMVEAWFFADSNALVTAGVPNGTQWKLSRSDVEHFATDDAAYSAATDASCPCWAETRKKKPRPKWLGDQRERHPKGYLQFLCLDGTAKTCTHYDETRTGAAALRGLNWAKLLNGGCGEMRFLRALLADLHFALRAGVPAVAEDAQNLPPTSLQCRPCQNVLHNL